MYTFVNSKTRTLQEHKRKKFCVVKFEGWDQVDVVPSTWLREPIASGEVKVMYPVDLTDTNKILKLVRSCAEVDAGKFVTYFVTIFASTSKICLNFTTDNIHDRDVFSMLKNFKIGLVHIVSVNVWQTA